MLLHPFLLLWLHVGHYVWKTLEVLSDAAFSRVSSDTHVQWEQSCLFTWGLRDLRLGRGRCPCKLSLSSLHPPSITTPGRSFPASRSGSLGCPIGRPPSRQVLSGGLPPSARLCNRRSRLWALFQCCNPKAKTKTRKNLASAQVLEAEWPEVRAAGGWARQIGPHPAKCWGCVSFC